MYRIVVTICIIFLVIASGFGLVYFYVQDQQAKYQATFIPVTVEYRHLTSEVEISGSTKASTVVDLSFKNVGIVETVPVVTGDLVATGTILMTLRSATIKNKIVQAQANLNAQRAKLHDLLNGTRPEQIAVTQAELASDTTMLENARQALLDVLSRAQSEADVTVRFTIDQFINNPMALNSQFTIPVSDYLLNMKVLDARREIGSDLSSWGARITAVQNASIDDLLSVSSSMYTYLQSISAILDGLTQIFALGSSGQSVVSQTAIAAARTTITTTNDALTYAKQQVRDAQSTIEVAKRQLALEKAGTTEEVIAEQQAVVDSARAQIAELHDELNDQNIKAPFAGTITAVNAKQGETVAAGVNVLSMISNDQLKVEGFVPEIHYGEIAVGQPVRIQLDAFPGTAFSGTLGLIDPSAMLQDGVPNFKVTVYFTSSDERLKPGLTAHAFIQTGDKANVLALPLAAVTGIGTNATVMRVGATTPVSVILGTVGVDGFVEIISGLAERDQVLVNTTKQYRAVPN